MTGTNEEIGSANRNTPRSRDGHPAWSNNQSCLNYLLLTTKEVNRRLGDVGNSVVIRAVENLGFLDLKKLKNLKSSVFRFF